MTESTLNTINAVELYAGIGGFHGGVLKFNKNSKRQIKINAAYDYDFLCRKIYQSNYKDVKYINRAIGDLDQDKLKPEVENNLIFMSPPCQPFTRNGKKLDDNDERTESFFKLINDMLPTMLPKFIILENVKGYENSRTHKKLTQFLQKYKYKYHEFLLSPLNLGIPYQRCRYFLVATLGSKPSLLNFPVLAKNLIIKDEEPVVKKTKIEDTSELECKILNAEKNKNFIVKPLSEYLETEIDFNEFEVKEQVLQKYLSAVDIINKKSQKCLCFTANYGRFMKGTGSLIDTLETTNLDLDSKERKLKDYKLRFFTPSEILKLHGFSESFKFSKGTSLKQKYKKLGNSLSCDIVNLLLEFLFQNE